MSANIKLAQLRCLRAVIDLRGFTAAAGALHLTQSAISQAIANLERTVGGPLLVRGRDGVVPTEAGKVALAEARLALAAVDRLRACGAGQRRLNGSVSLGIVQSAAARLLPGWLRRLRSAHPGISVALYEGTDPEVTAWVEAGIVEVGVTSLVASGLSAAPIWQDEYLVVLPSEHPLDSEGAADLTMLDGQRMLLSGGGCEVLIQDLLREGGARPEIVCLVRDNETLANMVREGIGLTIMPELSLPSDRTGLVVRRLDPARPRTLHLLTGPAGRLGPEACAVLDVVREATADARKTLRVT